MLLVLPQVACCRDSQKVFLILKFVSSLFVLLLTWTMDAASIGISVKDDNDDSCSGITCHIEIVGCSGITDCGMF